MMQNKDLKSYFCDEPPIRVQKNSHHNDRRQISIRWLIGALLTAMISSVLMGVAFIVAFDGKKRLVTPQRLLREHEMYGRVLDFDRQKSSRLITAKLPRTFNNKRQMALSIRQKIEGREVIRSQTFELVYMILAESDTKNFNYPKFNALNLFTTNDHPTQVESTTQIYGLKSEAEITLQTSEFPTSASKRSFDDADCLTLDEIKHAVQLAKSQFENNITESSAFTYTKPMQLKIQHSSSPTLNVKIFKENVSFLTEQKSSDSVSNYSEDIIPLAESELIIDAFHRRNYTGEDTNKIAELLAHLSNNRTFKKNSVLRLGIETRFRKDKIVRASIYNDKKHYVSVALNDFNQYIQAEEPELTPTLNTVLEGRRPTVRVSSDTLPTVYDAVFQSALTHGMTRIMAKQLIRMLANEIDMQSRISSNDSMEVFYLIPDEKDEKDEKTDRDILYVSANFSGTTRRYYRFQSSNREIDYYDARGKSSKQFLLRKPVPNGVFRSPFGIRRHPILGYVRMHTGVDWSAPRGSPIVAAGDGKIIKAGWTRGYGYRTEIRHAHGYITSYSHQNAFAPGIKPGVQVYQGQIIGYIGSTGLSTGPHCHFEIIINNTKVDPMHIRLPDEKSLKGKELEAFKRDRDSLDLIMNENNNNTRVVSVKT
ncbi:MAG: hypothetical protein JSC085_000727 [Candidatus Tokpelaia sp. JSC085]|nr:MAG: hypothetical protein JSC085_000727 [Candidatus Tokpelaia sp. JSC085]